MHSATTKSLAEASKLLLSAIFCLLISGASAATPDFRAPTLVRYCDARQAYQRNSADLSLGILLARACFDIGEYATNSTERASLAEEGIAVCRKILLTQSNSAPARYYLGMNLGQLARTRSLSALKLVDQMEREFLAAAALDPGYDYAGPHRNLGLLYREAPSFGSVGSRTKAQHHLQKAVLLAPEYLDNRLNLIESYLSWNDRNGVKREFKTLQDTWSKAREKFIGSEWDSCWWDWDHRRKKIEEQVNRPTRTLTSPRNQ